MASHHPIRKHVTPEPTVIPDKLYFRIGDVARLCDVPAYVLRFWETEFPQLKPNKGGTGQRLYRKREVEMALRIKSLLYDEGYTIPGARQVFKTEGKSRDSSESTNKAVGSTEAQLAEPQFAQTQPVQPASALDIGAAIRQDAQHRDRLANLRDELRSLAALLVAPASAYRGTPTLADQALADNSASTSGKLKTMRPRLVLEPKPEPRHEPHLVDQGDLFSTE